MSEMDWQQESEIFHSMKARLVSKLISETGCSQEIAVSVVETHPPTSDIVDAIRAVQIAQLVEKTSCSEAEAVAVISANPGGTLADWCAAVNARRAKREIVERVESLRSAKPSSARDDTLSM